MINNINNANILFNFRDTTQLTMPEVKKILLISLNISLKGRACNPETQEKLKPLLQLAFYLIDKLRRFKLSKEVSVFLYFSEKHLKYYNCITFYYI